MSQNETSSGFWMLVATSTLITHVNEAMEPEFAWVDQNEGRIQRSEFTLVSTTD